MDQQKKTPQQVKRISRKQVRLSTLMLIGGMVLMVLAVTLEVRPLLWIGTVSLVASAFVKPACPHCGKRFRFVAQWSGSSDYCCSYCRQRINYDDEADQN